MNDAGEQPDGGQAIPRASSGSTLDLRDTDRPGKIFKLQLACYVLDAAKRLAAHGDRGPARQTAPLVSYSIGAVERRMAAHHGFRIHAVRVLTRP
jgi:hypothetical protein